MDLRCKVTFFDVEHQIRRHVELDAPTPLIAAEIALKEMIRRGMFLTDFGSSVKVEVINRVEHSLPFSSVARFVKDPVPLHEKPS